MGMSDRNELSKYYTLISKLHETEIVMWHFSISLHPRDRADEKMWRIIVYDVLNKLKLLDCDWVAFRHFDKFHDHVHLSVSRLNFGGVLQHRNLGPEMVLKPLSRELEIKHNLTIVPSKKCNDEAYALREFQSKIHGRKKDIIEETRKDIMRKLIHPILMISETIPDFIFGCNQKKIEVRIRRDVFKRMNGIGYSYEGQHASGSQLGPAYQISRAIKTIDETYSGLPIEFDRRKALEKVPEIIGGSKNWQGLEKSLGENNLLIEVDDNNKVIIRAYHLVYDLELWINKHLIVRLLDLYHQYMQLLHDEREGQKRFRSQSDEHDEAIKPNKSPSINQWLNEQDENQNRKKSRGV